MATAGPYRGSRILSAAPPHWRMRYAGRTRQWWLTGVICLLSLLPMACGGRGPEEPTPIPAGVVVPAQPTVLFPTLTPIQPGPTLTPAPPSDVAPTPTWTPFPLSTQSLPFFLDATALPHDAIALHAAPNGEVIGNVPSNRYLTAVVRSLDGAWLGIYTEDDQAGWVAADKVNLYGGEHLQQTDVLEPRSWIGTAVQRVPLDPRAVAVGVTTAEGLRVRNAPSTETGDIMTELRLNAELSLLGRNVDATWLKISLAGTGAGGNGDGWVFAQYVQVDQDVATLPVMEE